ncbi:GPW/gp25 family protein [Pseudomonas syringae]|uniref:GPW/gp25 family protein n=1 Tax=Pseudomonas syringae TaxID=317 RepID=UPI000EFE6CEF|nr:GPW/gp25 family protein [Pseudomonas azotoformans]
MNRETGGAIDTLNHIRQSLTDILSTRIGTRVMRREYGSLIPELIDQPANAGTQLRLYAATAMAVMLWERRISLSRVVFSDVTQQGQAQLDLEGTVLDGNQPLNLSIPLQMGAGL